MSRLMENQVKRGVAKLKHFSGSRRRMVNQHRTGVVSPYTQREITEEEI
jgi:hypothetical protein